MEASIAPTTTTPSASDDEDDLVGAIVYKYSATAKKRALAAAEAKKASGSWQSGTHADDRDKMTDAIVQLARQKCIPQAGQNSKVHHMANILEKSLYRTAPTFEAYVDMSTLKQRLYHAAMNLGTKVKMIQQQMIGQQQQHVQQHQGTQQQQQPVQQEKQQTQHQQPKQAAQAIQFPFKLHAMLERTTKVATWTPDGKSFILVPRCFKSPEQFRSLRNELHLWGFKEIVAPTFVACSHKYFVRGNIDNLHLMQIKKKQGIVQRNGQMTLKRGVNSSPT